MKRISKNIIMFILGCCFYITIEQFFRGFTFRCMGILGGIIFTIGVFLNNRFGWKMDLLLQCGIISAITTLFEAIIGNIDYYFLHWDMWDYSGLKYHYLNGKISLLFTFVWFLLGFVIVIVGDAIEYYWMHDDEQPEYWIFGKRIYQMPKRKCICN